MELVTSNFFLTYPQQLIQIKDLRFSFLGSYLSRKGKKIFLTQTENKLLYFFCKNHEIRILSNEIVDFLQGSSDKIIYSEQNIYVHINRLRKKLESKPEKPEILINMRPGYMLDADPYLIEV